MKSPNDQEGQAASAASQRARPNAFELEQWLAAIFDTSPMAMAIISGQTNRCVRANQALADFYGMTLEEIFNTDPFTLALKVTHPDDLVIEQTLFAEVVAGLRRSYQMEKRYVRPDGTVRWGLLALCGIYGEPIEPSAAVGAIRYAIVQVFDISDRKALEATILQRGEELKHAQKIDGVGRLAAGVAHDFNNLLTVISGHAELMLIRADDPADERGRSELEDGLGTILSATARAGALTAQLLAYGRREHVTPRHVQLSSAVNASQQLFAHALGSNIALEINLASNGLVFADPGQLGQVVMNLLLNARDAMPDGGQVQISTADITVDKHDAPNKGPGPGQWAALFVADSGHGMSPAVRAQIFEPFFTTRHERPGTQGTGLGLAVVQQIVQESGGHIEVDSAPGVGTTFTVYLPRVEQTIADSGIVRSRERLPFKPNSRRLLVVEDEPSVRSLLGTVLVGAHYWVRVARNAEEALRFIDEEREPFDLIVADLMMPGIDGLSLAKLLHERNQLPDVLFVSGYSPFTQEELAAYGKLLHKPFTPSQLLEAVSQILHQKD